MIKVLRDWTEIGEANLAVTRARLPRHAMVEKTWDLHQLYDVARTMGESRIVDLGCAGLYALKLLRAMGFSHLVGVDLSIPWRDRLSQTRWMWRHRTLIPPMRLQRADVTRTSFANGAFDMAVSISVIEHGVDWAAFLSECNRILRSAGVLFITTDYWKDGVDAAADVQPYGLPWRIFDRDAILDMIALAETYGFRPFQPAMADLECDRRCVAWSGREYTFICLVFRRT